MVKIYISNSEWIYANDNFVRNLEKEILKTIKNYESLS